MCVCVYVYVCMYMCVSVCLYVYCICTCVYICVCVCVCVYVCVGMYNVTASNSSREDKTKPRLQDGVRKLLTVAENAAGEMACVAGKWLKLWSKLAKTG